MGIIITQTHARIGIETTPGHMEMRCRAAKLQIHQEQARVNIHTELPKVQIDQHDAFASSGLKNFLELAREAAGRGYQQVMEFIGKTAEDGDRLAAIEKGGSPLADIAERDAYPEHEFGMVTMPATGPKFDVKGGEVIIEPERNGGSGLNGVEIKFIPGGVSYSYTPAQVRIYMKQYASIRFRYEPGNKVDRYI
ncbi:MAG: DUF6470 family protein [Clostridiales bacterium]|jgi:hypothetical protein|nr:DUF6470 family protein [Eubacteriales bacterium]MDH7566169.1 DUF6470 family protein [Clostridiales bacterium]